ncbi:MAG: TetR/AcrR family transcriptional regulator [Thermomicrobiales bacterium]
MEPVRPSESESRNRVLDAAYPLFVQQGYKAVSMQQIADAVSINKATLYHHFRSKDDLFLAVVHVAMRRIRADIEAVVQGCDSAQEQLVRIAAMMFRSNQGDLGRLMTDAHEFLPMEARLSVIRGETAPWDLYDSVFRTAVESGSLPEIDIRLASTMFIGLVYGQNLARKIGRIDTPLDESVARTIVDVLFAGLRSSAPSATAVA